MGEKGNSPHWFILKPVGDTKVWYVFQSAEWYITQRL
jgi:hypothetical protein